MPIQFFASFVWSKSIDDSSVDDDNITWLGSFLSLQDPNKPWLERSLSTFDIPYVFQFSYEYDLPIGRGKTLLGSMPRVADAIVGGWKANGISAIEQWPALGNVHLPRHLAPDLWSTAADIVGTPRRNHKSGWINNYFENPQVFQLPELYAIGDTPRTIGSVRTPTAFNFDLSMEKVFPLEKLRTGTQLEFRLETQNAFNHPVFGTPNTSVHDPSFGTITYTSIAQGRSRLVSRRISDRHRLLDRIHQRCEFCFRSPAQPNFPYIATVSLYTPTGIGCERLSDAKGT